jgi:hypothetical protein
MPAKRKDRLPRIRRSDARRKATFQLTESTDLRITVESKRRGITRSELVEHLLSAAVRGVVITFDGRQLGQDESVA